MGEQLSCRQVAVFYDIRNPNQIKLPSGDKNLMLVVYQRLRINAGGASGDPRCTAVHHSIQGTWNSDIDLVQALRDENERLRAEVVYLKIACLNPGEKVGSAEKARVIFGLRQYHKLAILLQIAELSCSTVYYQHQVLHVIISTESSKCNLRHL